MYICTYVNRYICTYVYRYIGIYVYMYLYVSVICICNMCICVYVYLCIYVYMYRMTGFGKQFVTTPRITVQRLIVILSAAALPFHISISLLGTPITIPKEMLVQTSDFLIDVFSMFL